MRGVTNTTRLLTGAIRAVAIVTFASMAWADAAAAAQSSLTISGEQRTVACNGETLKIVGQKNTVTVTGECRKVDVSGSNNTVAIEAVAAIEVTGTNNRITWQRSLRGDAPRVSATGLNTVTRASVSAPAPPAATANTPASPSGGSSASGAARAKPDREPAPPVAGPEPAAPTSRPKSSSTPPASPSPSAAGTRRGVPAPATTDAAVVVQEDGLKDTIDCDGREVSILGSRNTLRLRGSCPMLMVTGSDNEVDMDASERIRVSGDRNRIIWTTVIGGTKTPRVENTGQQNRITKADRKPVSP